MPGTHTAAGLTMKQAGQAGDVKDKKKSKKKDKSTKKKLAEALVSIGST
jgi:hypothetical protein